MSIQRMRRRFAVQLRIALWALTIAFIIGLPLVFVPGRFLGGEEGDRGEAAAAVLARVNDEPVPKSEAERLFEQGTNQLLQYYAAAGQAFGMATLWRLRLDAMGQAIQNAILVQQAKSAGVSVSKSDVRQRAEELVDQELAYYKSQLEKQGLEQLLARIVADAEEREPKQGERVGERQFRKWRREAYTDPKRGLRGDMMIERLQRSVVGSVSVTEEDLLQSYDVATVRRILVSLRPRGEQERTEEEARARAEQLLARANEGEDFAALARSESDDPAAERTGGLVEDTGRGLRSAEWDQAVFSLQPGQISGIIKNGPGYEIVKLEKLGRELPDDFEENKEQLLTSFAQEERDRVWREYIADLTAKAHIEVVDKEMLAYRALVERRQDEALALLRDAVPDAQAGPGLAAASLFYQLASLLASQDEWEEAAEFYAQSSDALSRDRVQGERLPGGRAEGLLGMGRAYENLGDIEEAVVWYAAASNSTEVASIHEQLRLTFERLGKDDLAKEEKEWLARYQERQRERQEAIEAQQKAVEEQQAAPRPPSSPESPVQSKPGD